MKIYHYKNTLELLMNNLSATEFGEYIRELDGFLTLDYKKGGKRVVVEHIPRINNITIYIYADELLNYFYDEDTRIESYNHKELYHIDININAFEENVGNMILNHLDALHFSKIEGQFIMNNEEFDQDFIDSLKSCIVCGDKCKSMAGCCCSNLCLLCWDNLLSSGQADCPECGDSIEFL